MIDPVNPNQIGPIGPKPLDAGSLVDKGTAPEGTKSFRDVFNEQINLVNNYLLDAGKAQEDLATGRTDNIDEVFAQVKKAGLHFKMLMQIRNKLMDAYEEISRMRI